MAAKHVSTKTIEKHLDRYGWKSHMVIPRPGETEGLVAAGWKSPFGESHVMVINSNPDKKALSFRVGEVLHATPDATPADRLSGLLMAIAYLNYESILGAWSYDPGDGEVLYKLAIPTDDGDISFEVFEHCMNAATIAVNVDAKNLTAIAEGKRSATDFLKAEGAKI